MTNRGALSLLIFMGCSGGVDGRDTGLDAESDGAVVVIDASDGSIDTAIDGAAAADAAMPDVGADAMVDLGCTPARVSGYTATSQPYSLFVVHLEHLEPRARSELHNRYMEGLLPLVARADELHIPLSIFMHQVWVDYILEEGLQDVVRSWIDPDRAGPVHEIGIHNHGPAHTGAVQSGYSNWNAEGADDVNKFFAGRAMNYDYLAGYRGTISDIATAIGDLVGTPIASGSTMQSWHESPHQLVYEQVGKGSGRNSRFARVRHWSPDGGVREAYLFNAAAMNFRNLDDSWARFTDPPMASEQTWGVTIHAHNFREADGVVVEEYLCALASIDPGNTQNRRRTVRDLMENVAIPGGNTFEGFCEDGYCDSLEAGPDPATANPFPIPSWGTGESTSWCPRDCRAAILGPSGTGNGDLIETAGEF